MLRRLAMPLIFAVLIAALLLSMSIPRASHRDAIPRLLASTPAGREAAGDTGPTRSWHDGDLIADTTRTHTIAAVDPGPGLPLALRAGRTGSSDARAPHRAEPWSPDRLLADATRMNDQHLALAVDPATEHLYAAWEAYDLGSDDRDIHVARSTDGGVTWTVREMPSSSEDEFHPDLAVDDAGYLHLVWARADGALVRARSAGPGDIDGWAFTRVFSVGEPVAVPSLAVSGSGDFARVFIACCWYTANYDWWQYEYTLLWLHSSNGGQTVGYDYLVPDGHQDLWPDVALDGARAYMVNGEQDPYTGRVRILAAADAITGAFVDYVDLSQTTTMSCGFPSVAADGEKVHLAWQLDWDDGLGNLDGDIMYGYSWDGLASVYGPYELIATQSESVGPVVFTRDGLVGCVWLEAPAGDDAFDLAARLASLDGHPDGWGDVETVTDQPLVVPQFRAAAGAVTGDRVVAAWVDRRDFPTQGHDVYAAHRGLLPDLAPHTPADWESPLVVSMVAGERHDSPLAAGHPAYASLALANLGLADATAPVAAELWLDGTRVGEWSLPDGLPRATMSVVVDIPLDMEPGSHALELRLDPDDRVAEADESDNVLGKDLWVTTGEPRLALSTASVRFEAPAPSGARVGRRHSTRQPVLGDRLAEVLAHAGRGERLRVVIAPAERLDPAALADLGRRGAIAALRDRADRFTRALAGRTASPLRTLWLSGELAGALTPAEIDAVADLPDVGAVWLDDRRSEFRALPAPRLDREAFDRAHRDHRDDRDDATRSPWPLELLGVPTAWAQGLDGSGILVGHTDSGVAWDHPDLVGHLWDGGAEYPHHGYDFLDEDDDPYDHGEGDFWHGTHTAGLVVSASHGAAPGARLLAIRCVPGYYEDMVQALQFCLDQGCRIITTSAGWTAPGDDLRAANRHNAEVLLATGVIWMVAAGNGDNQGGHLTPPDDISSPGDCPDPWWADAGRSSVITVGAVDAARTVWGPSSRGPTAWNIAGDDGYDDYPHPPGLAKPDLAAPGADITSTVGGGGQAIYSGTSMATPLVAGCAAILLQANPGLAPAAVAEALQATAADLGPAGRDPDTGAGLVDLPAAVSALPANQGAAVHVRNDGPVPLVIASIADDAPWLDVVPADGVVAPGDSLRVTLSWDAGGLAEGAYFTRVVFASNDPLGAVRLPVTLVVGQPVSVDDGPRPGGSLTVAPNPFNPRTAISFDLAAAGPATLRLYDPRGRLVRILMQADLAAGRHEVIWDGRDGAGRPCAAGVYLARLESGRTTRTGRMLLVR